jgi:membrane protein implicated in regulation of membrane protease activity
MIGFLIIGGVGFTLLVFTWIVGEMFDLGHDLAGFIGHEIGTAGVDLGAHDMSGHEMAGPSPFSSRVIFTFLTAFGGGGAIASLYGQPMGISILFALAAGLAMGSSTWLLARVLWQRQSSSTLEMSTLVGRKGRVVVGMTSGDVGQVTLLVGGGSSTFLARSKGAIISAGENVEVVDCDGDTLIVRRES